MVSSSWRKKLSAVGKLPESSESSQLVSVKGVARFASTTVLALLSPRPAKSKKSFLSAQPETETYSQAAIICHGRCARGGNTVTSSPPIGMRGAVSLPNATLAVPLSYRDFCEPNSIGLGKFVNTHRMPPDCRSASEPIFQSGQVKGWILRGGKECEVCSPVLWSP